MVEGQGSLGKGGRSPFYRNTNSVQEAPLSGPNHPKGSTSKHHHRRGWVSTCELGGKVVCKLYEMKLIIYCFPHYNVSPMRAETLYCCTYCASGSASHTVGAPQLQSCSDACFEKVNLFQHHLTIRKQFEHNVNFAFCVILFTRNPT